jgi:L-asparaginase
MYANPVVNKLKYHNAKMSFIIHLGTIGMQRFDTGALKGLISVLLNRILEIETMEVIKTISFEEPIDSSNMNPEE